MTDSMRSATSMRPTGINGCAARKRDGLLCNGHAVAGTDLCRMHPGTSLEKHKAKGAVVVELSKWGITDRTLDPGITLLQLMTQSFYRAQLYSDLLEQAYEAAERLAEAGTADGAEPPNAGTKADRERAQQDLDRVFSSGGVSALIGSKWSSSPGEFGSIYQTEEAIRGLVQLEAQERDRAAGMAAKAVAAGLATRQVELAERQGQLVAELVRALFADPGLALTPEQAAHAPAVAARHLRALAGGEAGA